MNRQHTLDPAELTWEQDNRSDQLQSLDDRINNIAQSLARHLYNGLKTEESLPL